jgi:hypothetical protein
MRAIRHGEIVVVIATADEAATIASCANETLEALQDWEFQTRVGVTRDVVEGLRAELNQALEN